MRQTWIAAAAALLGLAVLAAACGGGDDPDDPAEPSTEETTTTDGGSGDGDSVLDPSLFDADALVDDITEVDCQLDDGTSATCFQITVQGIPSTVSPGPFCPTSVDDPDHGIWVWDGEDPGLYALDAAFWELVDGQGFSFVGADGSITVQDPAEPASGGAGSNACLEATPAEGTELQALIPANPVEADEPSSIETVARVALGLDGVTTFGDAPSVVDTGNLPALDPCGGHYDPEGYYHHHFEPLSIGLNLAEAGIDLECSATQDPSGLFGYALDGHPIYGAYDADGEVPTDLDECNGHVADTEEHPDGVYHYHASLESPNLPPCLVGLTAEDSFVNLSSDVQPPGGDQAPGGGPGGGGPPANVAVAGTELGGEHGHCHATEPGGDPACH